VRRIRQKLNSEAGITALFALIVFAVAALASMAIVTAALNNASRLKGQQAQQGEYLASTSAAALLRKSLGGMTVTITREYDPDGATERADKRKYDVEPSDLKKLGEKLAAKMLEGSFSDLDFTLKIAGYSFDRTIRADYDERKLALRMEGDATSGAPPVTLIFGGADVEEISRIPTYKYNYDLEGNLISIEIEYWTVTSKVSLPADMIHAEAK
jgi:hypothetical protein